MPKPSTELRRLIPKDARYHDWAPVIEAVRQMERHIRKQSDEDYRGNCPGHIYDAKEICASWDEPHDNPIVIDDDTDDVFGPLSQP